MFTAIFIQSLCTVLGRIDNGRLVHRRDNLRQSLGFYVRIIGSGVELTDTQKRTLSDTVDRAQALIKEHWGHLVPVLPMPPVPRSVSAENSSTRCTIGRIAGTYTS